jgi:hypothetical protein
MPFYQEIYLLQLLCHLSKYITVGMPRASSRNAIPTILTADWCSSCIPVDISGQVILFKLEIELVNSDDSTTLPNLYTKRARTLIDISRDALHSILNSFSRICSSVLNSKRDLSFFLQSPIYLVWTSVQVFSLRWTQKWEEKPKEDVRYERIISYKVDKREQERKNFARNYRKEERIKMKERKRNKQRRNKRKSLTA